MRKLLHDIFIIAFRRDPSGAYNSPLSPTTIDMTTYTLDDIKRNLPVQYVERGAVYQRERRVSDVRVENSGSKITGAVQGGDDEPYHVVAYVKSRPHAAPIIHGNCSCPVGASCKHVAALLIHALKMPAAVAENAPEKKAPVAPQDNTLRDWFADVDRALGVPIIEQDAPERLLYVLRLEKQAKIAYVRVDLFVTYRLQSGTYGNAQYFSGDPKSKARVVRDADRRLLRWLQILKPSSTLAPRLSGVDGARLLADLLATGRCIWLSHDNPPLTLGAVRTGHLEWTLNDDGTQQLTCNAEHVDAVLPTEPPWFVDTQTWQCGPLDTGLPGALANTLLNAPPLDAEHAALVHTELARRDTAVNVPRPKTFERIVGEAVAPVPCLHLFTATLPLHNQFRWQAGADHLPMQLARLSFDYGGLMVEAGDPRALPTRVTGLQVMTFTRDAGLERTASGFLAEWGFVATSEHPLVNVPREHAHTLMTFRSAQDKDDTLLEFSLRGVPELRALGWRITMSDDYPYRIIEDEVGWYADVNEAPGSDWFDVELGITLGDQRLSLLPILVNLVRSMPQQMTLETLKEAEDKMIMVRMEDGRLLPVPVARIRPILSTLIELYDPNLRDTKTARMSKAQAAQLSELESALGARMEWNGGERLRELGKKLRDFAGIRAVAPPSTLNAQLRPYQQQGLNWLQFLREYELGGVLADDMGLGKTVQTLAHLLVEKAAGRLDRPSLVIAPTSLMVNWRMEAERFAPSLRVLVLHGAQRKQNFDDVTQHDVVLTTYPLLPRDFADLSKHEYHLLILDEAHNIKNPKAKASQLVRQLSARHRLCLTGTPMENHLGELWSLFDFLMPGLLGDETRFRRLFRTPIEKHGDQERQQSLNRRLAPFMLRRTKQEVVQELPPKTEMLRSVELNGAQRDLYESIRLAMHDKVQREIGKKGMARSHIIILDALLKLRQVCCDPRLLKLESAKKVKQSAKLELLMDMLPELIEEGRRVLLFSQFTSMLALIEEELRARKLDYVKLTGDTKDRATPVQRFQNCEVPLFLISLKAGGTGLNLTAADTVIHYDPWWNPAAENQATDRAHRIGQDKPVFVYKLLTEGTVEEKILKMQTRKKALADSLFNENGEGAKALSMDDLNALFEPLG